MLSPLPRSAAAAAALVLSACAGGDAALRADVGVLRSEVDALRRQHESLARRLDALGARLERGQERPPRPAPAAKASAPEAPIIPPDLAVVRVAPPQETEDEASEPPIVLKAPPRSGRAAPRLSTSVPISEPDLERVEALAGPAGREITAEADGELARARRMAGLDRARALESFVSRYPRHPSADNALVEAARAYEEAGRTDAACELARRVPQDYPAGDAVPGAIEIVASCERSRP